MQNHIPVMSGTWLDNIPLCSYSNIAQNSAWCSTDRGIQGSIILDVNGNCIYEAGDQFLNNAPLKLFDNTTNSLVSTTNSLGNGKYFLNSPIGNYVVKLDTANKPYTVNCQHPGSDTIINIGLLDTLVENIDFLLWNVQMGMILECNQRFNLPLFFLDNSIK